MRNTLKRSAIALLFICAGSVLLAQSPQAFNYQGVARNAGGNALVDQDISVRIAIIGSNSGEEYAETHRLTTSSTGIFSLKVGLGNPVLGDFKAIDWATEDQKSLKTSIDVAGGTNFLEIGTVSLLSVPYALYADSTKPQKLKLEGDQLSIEGGNAVTLPAAGGSDSLAGKSFLFLTGDITDAQAASKIASEVGANTSSIFVVNTTQLSTLDLSLLTEVTSIRILNNASLTSIDLSGLKLVAGDIEIGENTLLGALDFPELELVGGEIFDIYGNALTSFSAPKLAILGDGFSFREENQLSSLTLESILNGNVSVRECSGITSISLPVLQVGFFYTEECPLLSSVSLPNMTNGELSVRQNPSLTALSIPNFKKGILIIVETPLTQLDVPKLKEVSSLFIRSTELTTLDMSSVQVITNSFDISSNAQLSNLILADNVLATARNGLSFSNNNFSTPLVNQVLAKLVTWNLTNSFIELTQQGTAPPTGQGLLDIQTLRDAGNRVNTDTL